MNIMNKTTTDSFADILFQMEWESDHALHRDCYRAQKVNMWRDCFPESMYREILDRPVGTRTDLSFEPGQALPKYLSQKVFNIKSVQFDRDFHPEMTIHPREGRFYPKGILREVDHVFRNNISPFRCGRIHDGQIEVDFNHPMAGREVRVHAEIKHIWEKFSDTGGSCTDWMEAVAEGPGMQVRWRDRPTDFFSDQPFVREDEASDSRFYREPRLVNHIDDTAIGVLSALYGQILTPESEVLDLMSSWTSHLPDDLAVKRVVGLGLNGPELAHNRRLSDYTVHDLNENPVLPFEDRRFDAVVCSMSVEYLTRPFEVFQEVRRVLKPGGVFAVTFSNRWFPPKVIRIWKETHEFERIGLVMEYFLNMGGFTDLNTYSMRGLARPEDDKYYWEIPYSDPIYGVWGRKQG